MHVLYHTHPSLTLLLPGLELRICEESVCCGRRREGFGAGSEDWLHNWPINWCRFCLESGFLGKGGVVVSIIRLPLLIDNRLYQGRLSPGLELVDIVEGQSFHIKEGGRLFL